MSCQFNIKKFTHTLFSIITGSDTIISTVSASGFFDCFVFGCKNFSKSRAWKFGKEHMIVILKFCVIRFYESVIHFRRKKWLRAELLKNMKLGIYCFFSFSEKGFSPHEPQRKSHESPNSVTCHSEWLLALQSLHVSTPKLIVNLVTGFVCKASSSRLVFGNEFPSFIDL